YRPRSRDRLNSTIPAERAPLDHPDPGRGVFVCSPQVHTVKSNAGGEMADAPHPTPPRPRPPRPALAAAERGAPVTGEPMTGAESIVRSLEAVGVDTVFGIPGGAILPAYDPLFDSSMRHILVRHEHAARPLAHRVAHPHRTLE